jgi:hypothetical protein
MAQAWLTLFLQSRPRSGEMSMAEATAHAAARRGLDDTPREEEVRHFEMLGGDYMALWRCEVPDLDQYQSESGPNNTNVCGESHA